MTISPSNGRPPKFTEPLDRRVVFLVTKSMLEEIKLLAKKYTARNTGELLRSLVELQLAREATKEEESDG